MTLSQRVAVFTVSAMAMLHWGAAVAAFIRPCHVPWLHFSAIATVLTCTAAIITTKGSSR